MKKPSDTYRAVEEGTQTSEAGLLRAYERAIAHVIQAKEGIARGEGDIANIKPMAAYIFCMNDSCPHECVEQWFFKHIPTRHRYPIKAYDTVVHKKTR